LLPAKPSAPLWLKYLFSLTHLFLCKRLRLCSNLKKVSAVSASFACESPVDAQAGAPLRKHQQLDVVFWNIHMQSALLGGLGALFGELPKISR
jgi:hypothetical protein